MQGVHAELNLEEASDTYARMEQLERMALESKAQF